MTLRKIILRLTSQINYYMYESSISDEWPVKLETYSNKRDSLAHFQIGPFHFLRLELRSNNIIYLSNLYLSHHLLFSISEHNQSPYNGNCVTNNLMNSYSVGMFIVTSSWLNGKSLTKSTPKTLHPNRNYASKQNSIFVGIQKQKIKEAVFLWWANLNRLNVLILIVSI